MSGERLGRTLVALQFALMALQAWLVAPAFPRPGMASPPWGLLSAAVVLGLWALSVNRPGNFNIRPTPKPGARRVQRGPYRWIRHPMYSAVLLAGLAGVVAADGAVRAAAGAVWLLLCAVLWVKSRLEEQWLAARHPGYRAYQRRTRRFVPWLL